jgi:hypothetical protein
MAEVPIDIVSSIYDAATDATSWSRVLTRLTSWAGGVAGGFNVRRSWPEVSTTQTWVGLEPKFERAYTEHYFRFDPWAERAAALPEGRTMLSREVISDEELQRTAFWNELVRPQGFRDLQGAMLLRDEHRMVTFAMFRPEGQTFDETTRTRLDALIPHLTRALRLALSLDEHGDLGSAVAAATAARRLGVLRVDASLHVLGSFAGAEPWLAGGTGPLGISGRRLTAGEGRGQGRSRPPPPPDRQRAGRLLPHGARPHPPVLRQDRRAKAIGARGDGARQRLRRRRDPGRVTSASGAAEHAEDGGLQLVGVEGLAQPALGVALGVAALLVAQPSPAHEDHPVRQLGPMDVDPAVELEAAHHRHHQVAQDHVEGLAPRQAVLGVLAARLHHHLAVPVQEQRDRARQRQLVVDHQDARRARRAGRTPRR